MTLYRVPKGKGDRPATQREAALPRLIMPNTPGAHPWQDYDVVEAMQFGRAVVQDEAFQAACEGDESIEYHGPKWVAMSRARYEQLTKSKPKIYIDEAGAHD